MRRMAMPQENLPEQELTITRTFDAPRELVWKAWTDPERIKKWWGPKDYTSPVCRIDLRVGGKYLFSMRSPEGKDFYSTGTYREIVPPERIVCTDSFADEHGNVVPASHYGMNPDFPLELLVTVVFEKVDGKTKMTLRHLGMPAGEMSELTQAGWNESFDKLAETLRKNRLTQITAEPGRQEVVITRVLDAPRGRVWKIFTDPNLIPEWWGPKRFTTTVDKMELRPGGAWRFRQRDADGNDFAFHGVYHEITAPARLVDTFEFEGMPGHALLETAIFEEQADGKTKLTARAVFETVEDRDGMLESGMAEGAIETWERFAELLAKVQESGEPQT